MRKYYKKLNNEKIESISANARASLSMEGLEVTVEETETIRKYLSGLHTEKEVLENIRKS